MKGVVYCDITRFSILIKKLTLKLKPSRKQFDDYFERVAPENNTSICDPKLTLNFQHLHHDARTLHLYHYI